MVIPLQCSNTTFCLTTENNCWFRLLPVITRKHFGSLHEKLRPGDVPLTQSSSISPFPQPCFGGMSRNVLREDVCKVPKNGCGGDLCSNCSSCIHSWEDCVTSHKRVCVTRDAFLTKPLLVFSDRSHFQRWTQLICDSLDRPVYPRGRTVQCFLPSLW